MEILSAMSNVCAIRLFTKIQFMSMTLYTIPVKEINDRDYNTEITYTGLLTCRQQYLRCIIFTFLGYQSSSE